MKANHSRNKRKVSKAHRDSRCCLWDCDTLKSSVTADVSGPCWRLLLFMARGIRFFFLPFLFPSFIPGGVGSYYPSWNDFNRDTAIPRELSHPAATQSIANWTGLWFIENPLFWRTLVHTHTHTGNSPSAAHDVLGRRSRQFRRASFTGKQTHRSLYDNGYGTVWVQF